MNAAVVNLLSGQNFRVRTEIRLSYLEAHLLKIILAQRYYAAVLTKSQGIFKQAITETGDSVRPVVLGTMDRGISLGRLVTLSRPPSLRSVGQGVEIV